MTVTVFTKLHANNGFTIDSLKDYVSPLLTAVSQQVYHPKSIGKT